MLLFSALLARKRSFYVLILGGNRNILLCGEMREECDNLLLAHLTRVALAMEQNEAPNPVQISLLGTQTIAPRPHKSAELIEQFGLASRRRISCNWFQFPSQRK